MKLYFLIYLWLTFKAIIFTSALVVKTSSNPQSLASTVTHESIVSPGFRLSYRNLLKNLGLNKQLDLRKRYLDKKDKLSFKWEDVFNNLQLAENLKDCLRSMVRQTRCDVDDLMCICDSIKYYSVVDFYSTLVSCFSEFSIMDKKTYYAFHEKMCNKLKSSSSQSVKLYAPSEKQILCIDPHKDLNLPEEYDECLKTALENTLCKKPYDAACLCDSRAYWATIDVCKLLMNTEENQKIEDLKKSLCKNPEKLSGCSSNYIFGSRKKPTPILPEEGKGSKDKTQQGSPKDKTEKELEDDATNIPSKALSNKINPHLIRVEKTICILIGIIFAVTIM